MRLHFARKVVTEAARAVAAAEVVRVAQGKKVRDLVYKTRKRAAEIIAPPPRKTPEA